MQEARPDPECAARVGYAAAVKGYSIIAPSGAAASAFRTNAKSVFRFGVARGWRPVDTSKYPTDSALRAAAGRSNIGMNLYGLGVLTQPGNWGE